MSGHDNLPTGGTGEAQPLSLDDAMNLEWTDPGADNGEPEEETQSEAVPGEAEEDTSQEAEDIEATAGDDAEGEEEGETDEASEPAPEPADDVTVTVNGESVALSDLKSGYMRQADYSRKTMEVAETRKGLEAMSARVTNTVNAVAEFLVKQIPPAPDQRLAMTDPNRFVQQKAMHEAAVQQVDALLGQASQVKEVATELTQEQAREQIAAENAKLVEVFPQTATKEGRQQFFEGAASAARELGYSEQEIAQAMDHRMFALAHYASIGMKSEQAREKAKAKVHNAPPVAPQKRQQSANASKNARSREAMKRLARTGSIEDAMSIDFE